MIFPRKLCKLFIYLLVGLIGFLCVHQPLLSFETPVSADGLSFQGQAVLEDQNYQQAISLFQQAEALYAEEVNQEGVTGTQVNQAIALGQAGHKHRACNQLSQVINVSGTCDVYGLEQINVEHSIDTEPGKIGLNALSNLLIDLGYLEEADAVIERLASLTSDSSSTLLGQMILRNSEIEMILNRQKLNTAETIEPVVLLQIQHKLSESDRLLPQLLDAPTAIQLPAVIHSLKTETSIREAGISIKQTDKVDLYQSILKAEKFKSLGNKRFNALASSIDSLLKLGGNQQQIEALLEEANHSAATQKDQAKLALLQGRFLESQTEDKQLVKRYYQRAAELATLSHNPRLAYISYHQLALMHSDAPDLEIHFLKQAIDQLELAKETLPITPNLLPKLEYEIQEIFHDYMSVLSRQGQPIGPIEPI